MNSLFRIIFVQLKYFIKWKQIYGLKKDQRYILSKVQHDFQKEILLLSILKCLFYIYVIYKKKYFFFIVLLWYWVRVKIFIDILLVEVIIIIIVLIFNIFRIRIKILSIYLVIYLVNLTKISFYISLQSLTTLITVEVSTDSRKKAAKKKNFALGSIDIFFSYIVIPCTQKNTW